MKSLDSKLSEVNKLRTVFNSLSKRSEWELSFKQDLINDITYHSNKIEGLKLSYFDTIQFLKKGLLPTDFKMTDINELKNHQEILTTIFNQYETINLSEEFIKTVHKQLLNYPNPFIPFDPLNSPGQYKSDFNYTTYKDLNGKTITKEYLDPLSVPTAMKDLVNTTNSRLQNANIHHLDSHPITIAAQFHLSFCDFIHPFHDGNGRVGRLLSNLILIKKDFLALDVKSEGENIQKYMFSLINSTKSDMKPIINYWFDTAIESYEGAISRIKNDSP